ncbi:type II toxin-antitoxin system RelE/ParE family toxin [Candidatus Sumerlaeota bacterium]|nr:type II toxin-antitoxin system RelE/ParE family toxin [Candidatus Sumerlaeota bacterium]
MAEYEVLLRRSVVRKDLARIPRADVRRIVEIIRSLAKEPRPPGSKKLSGQERYRIRQGRYRIVYSIQDNERSVWVVKVGHRGSVHRLGI